jgi:hypothetical protein
VLTLLRENSLVTGKNTGNRSILAANSQHRSLYPIGAKGVIGGRSLKRTGIYQGRIRDFYSRKSRNRPSIEEQASSALRQRSGNQPPADYPFPKYFPITVAQASTKSCSDLVNVLAK